jgi:hypothetical protein
MSRIKLQDDMPSVVYKMSEGNIGAVTVLVGCLRDGGIIDGNAAFGGLAHVFDLDTLGIYGSRIWMLYKDVCKQDLRTMIAVLRAWQLGFLSRDILNHAIDNYGDGLDVPAMVVKVEERLPEFQRTGEETDATA